MSKERTIASRLREFGKSKFGAEHGWKKRFADALGVTSQHLDRYLSGGSEPGNKMYFRLIQIDCDIHWLLTGNRAVSQEPLTVEEKEMLAMLKKAGVDSADKLTYLLNPERLAASIAAAAVKEIQAKYRVRKNTGKK
ncbi:MAG: hypothetical protein HY562_09575 [Ignavibacteriales bacterium]|nr:hypothetical protein [Ignavibacteriales bacterium]